MDQQKYLEELLESRVSHIVDSVDNLETQVAGLTKSVESLVVAIQGNPEMGNDGMVQKWANTDERINRLEKKQAASDKKMYAAVVALSAVGWALTNLSGIVAPANPQQPEPASQPPKAVTSP